MKRSSKSVLFAYNCFTAVISAAAITIKQDVHIFHSLYHIRYRPQALLSYLPFPSSDLSTQNVEKNRALFHLSLVFFHKVLIAAHNAMGLPTAIEPEGIFFETTEPAPITQLSPMLTPGNTIDP